MAFIVERKISIQWKLNPDAFQIINKSVLSDITRRFGSTRNAVNTMLIKKQLLDCTMPTIIGMTASDEGWQKTVANYWNSLALDIPENGKELEIGFSFDLSDTNKSEAIKQLSLKSKFKTDEDLGNYVMSEVVEDEKYKYGTPLKAEDYLLWIYSKDYRDVANNIEDINKSQYIRFYIHDENIVKKQKQALVNLTMKAQEKFVDIVKSNDSTDMIYNILCVLEPNEIIEINKLAKDERQIKLFDVFSKNPSEFIKIAEDSNLHIRALIEQLLTKHILRKMPNTDVIVDVEDPSIVIGNTTNDAISWFSLQVNEAKITEYKIRLKA